MKRHNGRIISVVTLYNLDINNQLNIESINDSFESVCNMLQEDDLLSLVDVEYSKQLLIKCVNSLTEIDETIEKSIKNYTLDRLSYCDRSIIRTATAEMKYLGIPKEVVINEALEITKEYSLVDGKQVEFNNRLLDEIAKLIYE